MYRPVKPENFEMTHNEVKLTKRKNNPLIRSLRKSNFLAIAKSHHIQTKNVKQNPEYIADSTLFNLLLPSIILLILNTSLIR